MSLADSGAWGGALAALDPRARGGWGVQQHGGGAGGGGSSSSLGASQLRYSNGPAGSTTSPPRRESPTFHSFSTVPSPTHLVTRGAVGRGARSTPWVSPPLATVGNQAGGRRMLLQPGMGSGTDFRGDDDAWCLGASSPTEHVHKQALGTPLHGVPWEGRSEVQSSPMDWQNVSLPWSAVRSPPVNESRWRCRSHRPPSPGPGASTALTGLRSQPPLKHPSLEQLEPVPSRREYMCIHSQSSTPPKTF
jgi:hypothetical protein